jgi:ABC-type polysaccharide/polyol phosphate transport system ATPase subunit
LSNSVITVKNLNKTFVTRTNAVSSIRDRFTKVFSRGSGNIQEVKALKDINFEVQKGEFFGIVGRNGSGKSTLLHLLLGSIYPDQGSIIKTKGKMIRLALGMGFDGNLSARDNIYVNGTILGLTFKRIGLIFDDIIGFAELEEFVDLPVKKYSSGMLAKLKFAIAVHAEADIFLMDEFFGGVGDESFRTKSTKVFNNTFLDGRTIIHVSHQLKTISEHSQRLLVLDRSEQLHVGDVEEGLDIYRSLFPKKQKAINKKK